VTTFPNPDLILRDEVRDLPVQVLVLTA